MSPSRRDARSRHGRALRPDDGYRCRKSPSLLCQRPNRLPHFVPSRGVAIVDAAWLSWSMPSSWNSSTKSYSPTGPISPMAKTSSPARHSRLGYALPQPRRLADPLCRFSNARSRGGHSLLFGIQISGALVLNLTRALRLAASVDLARWTASITRPSSPPVCISPCRNCSFFHCEMTATHVICGGKPGSIVPTSRSPGAGHAQMLSRPHFYRSIVVACQREMRCGFGHRSRELNV